MKLVTIKEVSEFLRVKESTLYSWAHDGTIPTFKLGGLLRFDMDEVKEWVKKSRPGCPNSTLPSKKPPRLGIDRVIKKVIDDVTGKGYNTAKRETSPSQGLRKGG